jgi:hypothetical protein
MAAENTKLDKTLISMCSRHLEWFRIIWLDSSQVIFRARVNTTIHMLQHILNDYLILRDFEVLFEDIVQIERDFFSDATHLQWYSRLDESLQDFVKAESHNPEIDLAYTIYSKALSKAKESL